MKPWIFTIHGENDDSNAVVQAVRNSENNDSNDAVEIVVITDEPAQYGTSIIMKSGKSGTILEGVLKDSKNFMADYQWYRTVEYLLLGAYESAERDSFYDSLKLTWSHGSTQDQQKLVITIKQLYSMDNNQTTATIILGQINFKSVSIGSSQKALVHLIDINSQFCNEVVLGWNRDLQRKQIECERLQKQIQELIVAKKNYDEEVMIRFSLILNSKKGRINQLLDLQGGELKKEDQTYAVNQDIAVKQESGYGIQPRFEQDNDTEDDEPTIKQEELEDDAAAGTTPDRHNDDDLKGDTTDDDDD